MLNVFRWAVDLDTATVFRSNRAGDHRRGQPDLLMRASCGAVSMRVRDLTIRARAPARPWVSLASGAIAPEAGPGHLVGSFVAVIGVITSGMW